MIVAVPRESFPGETRVALIPASVGPLTKAGLEVVVERSAGEAAGFLDSAYEEAGAKIVDRAEAFATGDIILQVRAAGANPEDADSEHLREGQAVIATCDPLGSAEAAQKTGERGVMLFALELLPRITRAQSMDVLSSMATVAGYRAVLLAAERLPKMFPMLMTAAGTVSPARAFIMGAGVAGLQAIATAKRLGAIVSANDIRPAAAEQVESLGAKFVQLELETGDAEDKGGYAKEMGEDFLQKQRELVAKTIAESDVVVTTAAIPGRKAPILVTEEMVRNMSPGSVIVDLAAAFGGNCELTKPGEDIQVDGVWILGPTNLPAGTPYHASQMYAKNITTFLLHLVDEGELKLDLEDEIVHDTLITRDGRVVNPRVCEVLGIEPPETPKEETSEEETASEENAEAEKSADGESGEGDN